MIFNHANCEDGRAMVLWLSVDSDELDLLCRSGLGSRVVLITERGAPLTVDDLISPCRAIIEPAHGEDISRVIEQVRVACCEALDDLTVFERTCVEDAGPLSPKGG